MAVEQNTAAIGYEKFGQQIEEGRFTRTVRTDQSVNLTSAYEQIHAIDSNESFELLDQLMCFQDDIVDHLQRLFTTCLQQSIFAPAMDLNTYG